MTFFYRLRLKLLGLEHRLLVLLSPLYRESSSLHSSLHEANRLRATAEAKLHTCEEQKAKYAGQLQTATISAQSATAECIDLRNKLAEAREREASALREAIDSPKYIADWIAVNIAGRPGPFNKVQPVASVVGDASVPVSIGKVHGRKVADDMTRKFMDQLLKQEMPQ